LIDAVSAFIGDSLTAAGAGVVIATEEVRTKVGERLNMLGLNLAAAQEEGSYVALDAREMLAKFLKNGWPDAALFAESIGDVIQQVDHAVGSSRRVAAFGEMAALLWASGQHEAAVRLEQLWSGLIETHPLVLRCAYPMNGFRSHEHHESFMRICSEHDSVVPSESYMVAGDDQERLRTIASLQQKAQARENEIEERKNGEELLLSREEELRDFLENSVVPMHWVAADGTILWVNRAELKLLGYESDEYVGHHIGEFHVDASGIKDILQRLGRGEALSDYEVRLRHKNGSILHVRIHSNAFMQDGQFVHSRCFTFDITEQNRLEVELRESEEQFRTITETAADAIFLTDEAGMILFANRAAAQIFGYPQQELVGQSLAVLIPNYLNEAGWQPVGPYFGSGHRPLSRERAEVLGLHMGCQEIPLELSLAESVLGERRFVTAIARDISERKSAREARLRLAAIVESSDDAIVSKDLDGVVTTWNATAERMFGYKSEEIVGKPITLIVPRSCGMRNSASLKH
jgi:PAS domain S-box-containing protein